jgi:hypothetical protein
MSSPALPLPPIARPLRDGDGEWIVPAAILVLCQHLAAIVISHTIGFTSRPTTLKYMAIAGVISLVGGSVILLPKVLRLWREREARPIARLSREADWRKVGTYLLGFQLFALQMGALTWLKQMLPDIIPFWADRPLALLDRAILGTNAWRLVPAPFIHSLDVIYVFWSPVTTLAINMMLCLRASREKSQAILSYFLIVGLMGVCGQYLLSSAGPVFYDRLFGGEQFADLSARVAAKAPIVHRTVDYLWTSYTAHADQIGGGISAMPSLHVAVSAWFALAMASLWPRLRAPGWGFWLVMFIGSFGLGWHYFLDGVLGTLGAIACWVAAGKFLSSDLSNAGVAEQRS